MRPLAQTTFGERLGRTLGRAWNRWARLDRQANGWLVARGWAPGTAKAAFVIFKLAVLAMLLYAASLLALLFLFTVAAGWVARGVDSDDEQETEWKTGAAGFGLYRGDVRIDIGDPHEEP